LVLGDGGRLADNETVGDNDVDARDKAVVPNACHLAVGAKTASKDAKNLGSGGSTGLWRVVTHRRDGCRDGDAGDCQEDDRHTDARRLHPFFFFSWWTVVAKKDLVQRVGTGGRDGRDGKASGTIQRSNERGGRMGERESRKDKEMRLNVIMRLSSRSFFSFSKPFAQL